jgi:16S rRNA (guanine527-N7)-methyltransferase
MRETLKSPIVDNPSFQQLSRAYKTLVSDWNTRINLVSSRNVHNLLTELIEQSVQPLISQDLPAGSALLDVGSGAGLPAFPLKFARPDISLTLLEPRRMKWLFLRRVIEDLQLSNSEAFRTRLEDLISHPDWQHAYDLVTTRGTGRAADLFPWMEPLVKPGGSLWFYKGPTARRESRELQALTLHPVKMLELGENFNLIVVKI